jgi:haloacetate dehalogenase
MGISRPHSFDPDAQAEYVRCFAEPAAIHASCEDCRAAGSIDLVHDEEDAAAGRRLTQPLLALWGEHSFVGRHYDVPAVWSAYADDVTGAALPCDHYVPEEAPEETLGHLRSFLTAHNTP